MDLAVGLTATLPAAVAAAALRWPPAARGDRTFAVTVWLGLGVGLLLVPSIGGIIGQLVARGAQTLLPSLEAAYPWFLALAGTSMFASLGVVGRVLAPGAPRPVRLVRSLALAGLLTTVCGSIFAGAAIANELALRDRPAVSSRFGPTNLGPLPPARSTCARSARSRSTASAPVGTFAGPPSLRRTSPWAASARLASATWPGGSRTGADGSACRLPRSTS